MYSDQDLKRKVKMNVRRKPAFFSKQKWDSHYVTLNAAYSLFVLLFGIILLLWPVFSFFLLKLILGFLIFFLGGLHIFCFFHRKLFVVFGMLLCILGLGFLFPSDFISLNYLFSIYIIFHAIEHFYEAFCFYRHKESGFWVLIFGSILLLVCAILLIINPFLQMNFYELLGSFCILFELIHLTLVSLIQKKSEILGYN